MSGSAVRRLVAASTACLIASSGSVALGAPAAAVPNPCTIIRAATIATTVGLKAVTLMGKLSTRADGKVHQTLCTYLHATTTITIILTPHQPSGGSGGPPGMKKVAVSGLGSTATDYYDTNPRYIFANVSFTKAGIDATALANGPLANEAMVALAHVLYKALP
jgi:hypothetical protein